MFPFGRWLLFLSPVNTQSFPVLLISIRNSYIPDTLCCWYHLGNESHLSGSFILCSNSVKSCLCPMAVTVKLPLYILCHACHPADSISTIRRCQKPSSFSNFLALQFIICDCLTLYCIKELQLAFTHSIFLLIKCISIEFSWVHIQL